MYVFARVMSACSWAHLHVILRVLLNCPSTLFVEAGSLNQPQSLLLASLSLQLVLENSRWAATPTQHLRGIGGFELQLSCLQQKLFNLLAISPVLRGFFCLFVAFLFVFNHASPPPQHSSNMSLPRSVSKITGPHNLDLSVTLPGSFLSV